jgi:hypothetical protein
MVVVCAVERPARARPKIEIVAEIILTRVKLEDSTDETTVWKTITREYSGVARKRT